ELLGVEVAVAAAPLLDDGLELRERLVGDVLEISALLGIFRAEHGAGVFVGGAGGDDGVFLDAPLVEKLGDVELREEHAYVPGQGRGLGEEVIPGAGDVVPAA